MTGPQIACAIMMFFGMISALGDHPMVGVVVAMYAATVRIASAIEDSKPRKDDTHV